MEKEKRKEKIQSGVAGTVFEDVVQQQRTGGVFFSANKTRQVFVSSLVDLDAR
jgi:hypothetical protein